MSAPFDLEKLIGPRKPVTFRCQPDLARWQTYLERKEVTTFLFLDDSSIEKNIQIYRDYQKQNGISHYPVGFYSAKSFLQNSEVIEILGDANLEYLKEALAAVEQRTTGIPGCANGVAIYLARGDLMTAPHIHVYDAIENTEAQLAIWANAKNELPRFWFEIDGQKHPWPKLSSSNAYHVNGRYLHAGESLECLTVYLISFCRKLASDS